MVRNGIEDSFFIFHTGSFLPFHFHSTLKVFHSILEFSSIFHSILPYHGKFRPEATRNLYCIFATLAVPLHVVTRKGKQCGTMHSSLRINTEFNRKSKERSSFLWQIITCSLINLLTIPVRNFQRFSDRSFVSGYEPTFILKFDWTVKCNFQNTKRPPYR